MTNPESIIRINVDVTNPGQFIACCGLLELADRLWHGAEGWFEGHSFCLRSENEQTSLLIDLLDILCTCSAQTQKEIDNPETSFDCISGDSSKENEDNESDIDSKTPKTDPLILESPLCMTLDWWLDADGSDNLFKTWAANATSQQMFRKWQKPLKNLLPEISKNPSNIFSTATKLQGSYGFDSFLGWDAFDIGFSLNEHNKLKKQPTRPAVELLGAIGLQTFRLFLNEKKRLLSYVIWSQPLLPSVARVAASGLIPIVCESTFTAGFVSRGTFKGLSYATLNHKGDFNV